VSHALQGSSSAPPFLSWQLGVQLDHLSYSHGDLCGPISPTTPSGNRFILLLVDDCSRYMWASFLTGKDKAAMAIKRVQVAAERKSGNLMGALRTDRGGEFMTKEFSQYCAELGIRRKLTTPYTPQQNGVLERRN
jgi:transposase InsO family protein